MFNVFKKKTEIEKYEPQNKVILGPRKTGKYIDPESDFDLEGMNKKSLKTLIIGGYGTAAYTYFRYMILKEKDKSVLIDHYTNKDLIKILEKENIDSSFYRDSFDENRIINLKKHEKFFINCGDAKIYDTKIFGLENLVLRVGNDFNVNPVFKEFNSILIFSPRGELINYHKSFLKSNLPRELSAYIDRFNGDINEFIEVENNSINYNILSISHDDFDKMHNKLVYGDL
ncbi:hypothetical protein OD350_28525 (plasmid) [Clostridium beijerinckii]|uniref:hypothetical protein n=1 Tax=Clostridium beijerinckii TaxID=1520 RepID=UPI002225C528|nr:hypothetical protein [Clostridium beijerinckii]UYZ39020.1 hypothetical protein OD350_28525 [Clostridium beijerinckii]